MNDNNKTKIKLVFVPYLIIAFAVVIGWSFLDWLLFIKLNVYPLSENVRTLIIPAVLSVTSLFIWLRKRVGLLSLEDRANGLYFLILTVVIFGTSYFAQCCITVATDKMTHLSSISQLNQNNPSEFYTLKNFYLDKKNFSIQKNFSNESRTTNLYMNIYITVPILNTAKDTLGSNCIGWYGVQYLDKASGFFDAKQSWLDGNIDHNAVGIDTIENSEEAKKFTIESMMKFNNLDLNHFLYLARFSESEGDYNNYISTSENNQQTAFYININGDYDKYVSAIENNTKYDTKSKIVLLPCNEPLTERAVKNLIYALLFLGIGSLVFLIMVLKTELKSDYCAEPSNDFVDALRDKLWTILKLS